VMTLIRSQMAMLQQLADFCLEDLADRDAVRSALQTMRASVEAVIVRAASRPRQFTHLVPGVGMLRARGLINIAEGIAARHHVDLGQVVGRGRMKSAVRARAELCSTLRDLGLSLPEIGLLIDRDHTTVMGAIRAHKTRGAA